MPDYAVQIPIGSIVLEGNLTIPVNSQAVILFAHGSGSSRYSARNQYVAQVLARSGLSTLLVDLLTHDEDAIDRQTNHMRFDIGLLALRLTAAIDWLTSNPGTGNLRLGLFGASTGAGAALVAAAARPDRVGAIVSRGGRPDLARQALQTVRAPTLLIVGGQDEAVIKLNRDAYNALRTLKAMEIVPGAGHLFEEPGTLERVAEVARGWFIQYLNRVPEQI